MQKDIVIKKAPFPKAISHLITLIFIGLAIEMFWHERYIIGSILVIISATSLFISKWEPKKAQALIKISDDRLWTRNRGNKPWTSILLVKFRFEGMHQVYMDLYISNDVVADEEVNLHGINMPIRRLKRILKRYARVENH